MLFDVPEKYEIYSVKHKHYPFEYIGMTNNMIRRMTTHKSRLKDIHNHQERIYQAIRQLGESNFTLSVIDTANDRNNAEVKEYEHIQKRKSVLNKKYNAYLSDHEFYKMLKKYSK